MMPGITELPYYLIRGDGVLSIPTYNYYQAFRLMKRDKTKTLLQNYIDDENERGNKQTKGAG